MIDRVTITGADDSVKPWDLLPLSSEFPFVEWGILYSGKRQGSPRYPSPDWLRLLSSAFDDRGVDFCGHLCGSWVRDIVTGAQNHFKDAYPDNWRLFKRVQLNFHGQYHRAHDGFMDLLSKSGQKDWIFQHDGENDGLIAHFTKDGRARVFPLFDRSGGAGVVPKAWPAPIWSYQGYAGGLGGDDFEYQIRRILAVAGEARIWIDMETKVRSDDDSRFDLGKVRRCLEIAAPFVKAVVA
jgi:hypothetical protein